MLCALARLLHACSPLPARKPRTDPPVASGACVAAAPSAPRALRCGAHRAALQPFAAPREASPYPVASSPLAEVLGILVRRKPERCKRCWEPGHSCARAPVGNLQRPGPGPGPLGRPRLADTPPPDRRLRPASVPWVPFQPSAWLSSDLAP